jgi:hypothetical protein
MITETVEAPTRSLTFLCEAGDVTLTWQPDEDEHMLALIERKMAAGVSFFIVPQRKPKQRGSVKKPFKMTDTKQALKYRALSIPDSDLSKFVLDGRGTVTTSLEPPKMEDTKVRRAKTAKEVATNHTVAVRPRAGG